MDNPDPLLAEIVETAFAAGASDILMGRGRIAFRIDGEVMPTGFRATDPLYDLILAAQNTAEETEKTRSLLYGEAGSADFAVTVGTHRLRANLYRWHGGLGAALRPLPSVAHSAEMLGIPESTLNYVLKARDGLILVNGPTGSGKSSTLNCLVEYLNANRAANIITIEEPIEYLYSPKSATIQQREIGKDVGDFAEALRSALRQNPDVIVIGEIRDDATLVAALQGAETGHLVMGTLHTGNAASTISRLVNMAPGHRQGEVRSVLASVLKLIICQRLLKRCDEPGRVAVREILINTPSIAALIREGADHQITSNLLTGRKDGMVDWGSSLRSLYEAGTIDKATYTRESHEP